MTFDLMKLVILAITTRQISSHETNTTQNAKSGISDKIDREPLVTESVDQLITNTSTSTTTTTTTTTDSIDTILLNNVTSQTTQERVLSHTKRGAPPYPPPHPPRVPKFPHHLFAPLSSNHHHHHHPAHRQHSRQPRSYYGSKSHRKYRRARKKPTHPPSVLKMPPHMKSPPPPALPLPPPPPYKRPGKPILLSEMIRAATQMVQSKAKPPGSGGPPLPSAMIKDYFDEDEIESIPFSAVDGSADPFPSAYAKFPPSARPSSHLLPADVHDEIHESMPPSPPMEEEIIVPGTANMRPFSTLPSSLAVRRPSFMPMPGSWSSSATKGSPSNGYAADEDYQSDTIHSVRVAKPQQQQPNTYIDKDIVNLLAKIKSQGLANAEDAKSATDDGSSDGGGGGDNTAKDNTTEINAAISKLLLPFLSESAIKQIQSYFSSRLSGDKQQDERNLTKVVYIIDNNDSSSAASSSSSLSKENASHDGQYKTYSITEPLYENGTNNTTYFIMVKSPESNNSSNRPQYHLKKYSPVDQNSKKSETRTTTTPTPPNSESIALQNYIMSLAGINYSPANYLPHFHSFQKQLGLRNNG